MIELIDFDRPKEIKVWFIGLLIFAVCGWLVVFLATSDSDKLKTTIAERDKQINEQNIKLTVYSELLKDCQNDKLVPRR